jgi:multidrug efflux system membrane fusion protein
VIVLVAVWMAGCNRAESAAPPPAPPPAAVTVSAAVAKDVPLYLEEIGATAAREYVNLQPMVGGPVLARHFEDGADVRKDQLLFTIDPRPYEAAVAQAEANVAQQQASLALAKQDFKRVAGLIETKAVSQQEFDQKKSAVAVSEAMVGSADAAVRTAKLNLEYCYVKSPIDGRAGQRQVDVGNVVRMNDQALVVVQRLDPIYADFTITERDLPAVRDHIRAAAATRPVAPVPTTRATTAPARETGTGLAAEVWVPGHEAEKRVGELTFLDTAVQQGTGRVKLRVTVPNADRYFWAGQFVNVRLVLEVKRGAVLVPSQAVQIGQAGPYVYVASPDAKAQLRPIKQGQRQGDQVVIESGVAAGDRVVTTGQKFLFPGAPVNVLPATPDVGHATTSTATQPAKAQPSTAPATATSNSTVKDRTAVPQ